MEASAYDDSLEAVAAETSKWIEEKAFVPSSQSSSSSESSLSTSGTCSPLGVVPVFRVSRAAFQQVSSSADILVNDDGQFGRTLAQIVFDNEHNLMLADPPVCIPGPLEQLLAISPPMRDAGTVKAITIALSCLPFFQGFCPAAAAAAAAHMTCATVMTNHVVSLQGETECLLPNGQRIVQGAWGAAGCGGSETIDAAERCLTIMLVVRGCVSVRQSPSNPDVRLWAAAKNIKGSNTLKNLCKAAFGDETALLMPGDVRKKEHAFRTSHCNNVARFLQNATRLAAARAPSPPSLTTTVSHSHSSPVMFFPEL